jgi:hypothetical protein
LRETRRVPQTDTALEALAGDRLGGHSRSLDSHLLLWRMIRVWLTRNRELLFPAITVLIAFFLLANLVKHGILAPSALAANKDALSALNSTVNVIVIIFGAIFSYYRFFRGRTFFARADVDIGVTLLPTTADYNIHVITLTAKNIGNLTIWEPVPEVTVFQVGPDGTHQSRWDNWREARSAWENERMLALIDSGETVTFTGTLNVHKTIWAVTYIAFLRSSHGEIWKHSLTVSNLEKKNT